jgi:hypothetical protein
MLTLKIEDEKIEHIFLNEFHSNKDKFFEFIQNSYDKMKSSHETNNSDENFLKAQESSMFKTWDNQEDKVWDEL